MSIDPKPAKTAGEQAIVDECVAKIDALRVSRLTVAQLQANVNTYPRTGPNGPWRILCEDELTRREADDKNSAERVAARRAMFSGFGWSVQS